MKKILVILVLFVFVGSVVVPAIASSDSVNKVLVAKDKKDDGDKVKKDKKSKKHKCAGECSSTCKSGETKCKHGEKSADKKACCPEADKKACCPDSKAKESSCKSKCSGSK